MSRTIVAFGSESGNAKRLAGMLAKRLQQNNPISEPISLNQVDCTDLTDNDLLLIITSSFGDGEPPANAEGFLDQLPVSCSFRFAVFGLGDVSYPNFCGYSKHIDRKMIELGAQPLAKRVDADIYYNTYFDQWSNAIEHYLDGNPEPAQNLELQVAAYGDSSPYEAKITCHERISADVLNVELDIKGSGIHYAPGDLVYIYPQNDPELLDGLSVWFGADVNELADKDLRNISKHTLKFIATVTSDEDLKELLKFKNRAALQEYTYEKDILDLLEDRDPEKRITLDQLVTALPAITPRAYSIASAVPDKLRLCMREVSYDYGGRRHRGISSGFMGMRSVGDLIKIAVRPNPEFAFDQNKPAVMIGTGVGLAPFISYLEQISIDTDTRMNILIFGERYSETDFLYQDFLMSCYAVGVLDNLFTAFSRDQDQKVYVQDVMHRQAAEIYDAIQDEAVIYVCGNKAHLGNAVNDALMKVLMNAGSMTETQAIDMLKDMEISGRIRRDLF